MRVREKMGLGVEGRTFWHCLSISTLFLQERTSLLRLVICFPSFRVKFKTTIASALGYEIQNVLPPPMDNKTDYRSVIGQRIGLNYIENKNILEN